MRFQRAFHEFAGVFLMLWSPSNKLAGSEKNNDQLGFSEAARQASASISGGTDSALIGHHSLVLESWRQFIGQWLSTAAGDEASFVQYLIL